MTKSLKEKTRLNYIKDIRSGQSNDIVDKSAFRFKYGHSISSYYDQVDSPKEIKIFKPIYKKLFGFVRGNITHKDNKKLRNYIEDILVSTWKNLDIFEFKIILHFLPAFVGKEEISFYLVASIYNNQNDHYIGEINFSHSVFETDHMIVFNRETKKIYHDSLKYFNEKLDEVEDHDRSINIHVGKSYKHLKDLKKLFNVCKKYQSEIEALKKNPDFTPYDENVNSYSTRFNVNSEVTHCFSVNRKILYLPSIMNKTPMGAKMATFLKSNKPRIKVKIYTSIDYIDYKTMILEEFINKGFFDNNLVESYNHEKHSFEEMMEMNALQIY